MDATTSNVRAPSGTGFGSKAPKVNPMLVGFVAMLGGGAQAAFPAAVLIISAQTFDLQDQTLIAISITFSRFIGQFLAAIIIESKLADRQNGRSAHFPIWILLLSSATALLAFTTGFGAISVCITLPFLFAAFEVGRAYCLTTGHPLREAIADVAGLLAVVLGFVFLFIHKELAVATLILGFNATTWIRFFKPLSAKQKLNWHVAKWIILDLTFSGLGFPVLNLIVLWGGGDQAAVSFVAIATVAGAVGVPTAYLRLTLLKEHKPNEVFLAAAGVTFVLLGIIFAESFGIFNIIFGSAWPEQQALAALTIACTQVALSVLTTIPFAALRRNRRVREISITRGLAVILLFLTALITVKINPILVPFAAMLLAEVFQFVAFSRLNQAKETTKI